MLMIDGIRINRGYMSKDQIECYNQGQQVSTSQIPVGAVFSVDKICYNSGEDKPR